MGTKIQLTAEEKYRLLREISYRVRDTLDLKLILDHLLDTVNQVLPYDAAGIFVLNRDILRTPYHRTRAQIAGIASGVSTSIRTSSIRCSWRGKGSSAR